MSDAPETAKAKLTKAERLEAKAARLRAADEERATRDAAQAELSPPAGRARRDVVILAVASVLIVALIAALVVSLWHAHTLSSQRSAAERKLHRLQAAPSQSVTEAAPSEASASSGLGQSAIAAAKVYAVEFGSYDYRHLDADFAKVAAHLTPSFKKSYLQSSSQLKPAIEQVKGVAVGTVRAAGLVSATSTTAVVTIFLDQKVTTAQSSTPRIDRDRLIVTLTRSGDSWLISKLTSP
jgi:cytoskeletal protein RodZ